MKTHNERRKNYYIKKEFQRSFIIKFCSLVIVGAIITGLIIYFLSRTTVTTSFENSRLAMKTTADFILPAILLSSAITVLLIGIATIIVTLFTSHKIAGPLFRIERGIEEMAGGNLSVRFNLRSTDEIKALAVSLDVMAHNLRANLTDIKKKIAALEQPIEDGDKESAKGKLAEVQLAVSKFKT